MGRLYVVPTPVGNLKDITLRAIDILREAGLILAEDTRKTSILLNHYSISKPVRSYHKFNEHKILSSLTEQLLGAETIALVSDAGTPGISDPGFLLVRECIRLGIEVECLPGPTAFIPALINSGFPCDRFIFEGFLPQKKGRQKRLEELKDEKRTLIFYESPFRLVKTLGQFSMAFGTGREVSVSREISKIHEETVRGPLDEVISYFEDKGVKGEFVIVLKGSDS